MNLSWIKHGVLEENWATSSNSDGPALILTQLSFKNKFRSKSYSPTTHTHPSSLNLNPLKQPFYFSHYILVHFIESLLAETDSEQLWSVKVKDSQFQWQLASSSHKQWAHSPLPPCLNKHRLITLSSNVFFECYFNKFRLSSPLSFIL